MDGFILKWDSLRSNGFPNQSYTPRLEILQYKRSHLARLPFGDEREQASSGTGHDADRFGSIQLFALGLFLRH